MGLSELLNAFQGDAAVLARWSWKGFKPGFGLARGAFWVTFIAGTGVYVNARLEYTEAEYLDFQAQTNFFMDKVDKCRNANPYDVWRILTPEEVEARSMMKNQRILNIPFKPFRFDNKPLKLKTFYLPEEW